MSIPFLALGAILSSQLLIADTGTISHVPGFKLVGPPTEAFGAAVSAAGDVNRDGFNDLMVYSLDLIGPGVEGIVRVYSGVDGALLYTFGGLANHPFDGPPMSGAGDVNGDGFADMIVGNASVNQATIYSGRDGNPLFTFTGDAPDDGFGGAVASAGDVNADGRPDIIIGNVAYFPISKGYARVFSGADGAVLFTLQQESAGDHFGSAVSGAGDVNGDGHADLLVGAHVDGHDFLNPGFPPFIPPFWDEDHAGAISVFSGADGSLLWTAYGDNADDGLGWSVAPVGDVNGDGRADVIMGAHDGNPPAAAYARLLSGADGSTLQTFPASSPSGAFFLDTSRAGDLDGDGIPDVLVAGAVGSDPQAPDVHVYSGADGHNLFSYAAIPESSQVSAAGLGDINGDGIGDFVVGALENITNGGYAQVFVSQGAPPSAIVHGCGINPPDSMAIVSGSAALGQTLTLSLDDPSGTMKIPAAVMLAVSTAADPAFPCGKPVAGWGLSAPGATGELLIDVTPPHLLFVLGVGTFSGAPVTVPIIIPELPALVGLSFHLQGALVDKTRRIGLTDAVALTIGVP